MSDEFESSDGTLELEGEDTLEEDNETSTEEDGGEDTETEMDLPTALAELEEARRYIRKVNRESASRRHQIAELEEKLEQHTKTGDDASQQLSELQSQLSVAKTQLAAMRMRDRFDEVVAKEKIPFVNLTAQRDAFEFAKSQLQELTDEATDEDYLDVIKDVIKSRPYLRVKSKPKNINSTNKGTSDEIQGLDMEEIMTTFGLNR